LGPCINAFQHYRPITCIDGTFLTEKYKGNALTAIGVDDNNKLLLVAFAFVDSENIDSSWNELSMQWLEIGKVSVSFTTVMLDF
jgi:hypothetical protein